MTSTSTKTTRKKKAPPATILVVEDNPDQWGLIRWALQKQLPEVEPVWLTNIAQTLAYLDACSASAEQFPKLVLLDLYLPRRDDGWQLLELIKTHHTYRLMPVVIMSHSDRAEDIEESYVHRGTSYMVKPVDYQQWLDYFQAFRRYWWHAVVLPTGR
ncbi:CheY-like chemotaxis protein [Spirosoma lacussanchae]|uniref:response regulator n=1 Tax=Spirosoma lacussanchae TaxID=1884249 RepID=UPI001108ADCC|nr:response regulator [Spirosoma lacussanchae]